MSHFSRFNETTLVRVVNTFNNCCINFNNFKIAFRIFLFFALIIITNFNASNSNKFFIITDADAIAAVLLHFLSKLFIFCVVNL